MARVIGIMGESGSGKTTSMRNLDPKTTFYIDCDKKGLSWKGWKSEYSMDKKNYWATDKAEQVLVLLKKLNDDEKYKNVNVVIVDTLNGLMVADEFRRMQEKNYDKWMDLAASVYFLLDYALTMRDDISVIFTAHTQTDHDEGGYLFTRIKTSGRKLDKICLESKLTTVLLAKANNGRYVFETQANNSTAKSPMGAIKDSEIENDITLVLKALKDY